MRIVSLVPSLTEFLIELNLDVVGRTKFCIYPTEEVKSIPKIGGTKTVDSSKVKALKPDLVIANKEENIQEQVEEIIASGINVHVSNIVDYETAIVEMKTIGVLTNKVDAVNDLSTIIKDEFAKVIPWTGTVCYLIWRKPYMTVGGDTYINSMLEKCGLKSTHVELSRYPSLTLNELAKQKPDFVMLSSEPFPFKGKHIEEVQKELPDAKTILVDGTYYSWYGSRMADAPKYFNSLYETIIMGKLDTE